MLGIGPEKVISKKAERFNVVGIIVKASNDSHRRMAGPELLLEGIVGQ